MSTSRTIAWVIWLSASIFYAYQYILRVMPNIMLDDLMHQFNIDAAIFGQYSGVYYIGYCLMHLPLGIMLDRYGPRKVMTGCILLTVVGLLPILFTGHWIYPIVGRFLIGMGSSAAILGTFKIIRMTFKEQQFTRMLSFTVTIGLIGAIYGGGPVSYFCMKLGYQTMVQIFAGMGVGLAALTYWIVPDLKPMGHHSVITDVKEVFTNRKVLAICFFSGLMVGPMEGFADAWGSTFLKQIYHLDVTTASFFLSLIYVGMGFGGPLLSFISEKNGNYLRTIIGAGVIMSLGFMPLIFGFMTKNAIIMNFILIGMCSAYQIIAIYKASTYVPERVASLTTAVANMIIMSFGYAFHAVIGNVVNLYGGPEVTTALVYGIGIIPLTLIIGTVGFLILYYKEQRIVQLAKV